MYEFTRDNGFQPSYRDMARQFHFNSINGLVSHMRALQKKGFLLIPGNETRSIRFKVRPDGQPFTGFADKVQSTGLEPRLPEEADFDGGDQES
jgi:SOS-response transcriptional repressor LexA